MAQRFKAEQLKELIRILVREELTGAVKQAINEILSDRYLQQIAEAAASRPRGVGRTMHIADGDDNYEEGTPEILSNTTMGIYNKHPMKHDDRLEDDEPELVGPSISTIPEGIDPNDMRSLFFEGTRPINEIDADAGVVFNLEEGDDEGVPVPQVARSAPSRAPAPSRTPARRPLNEVWSELAGVKKEASRAEIRPGSPLPVDPQVEAERMKFEEARLKRLRDSLERPA
jgi:hypothetical protein